MKTTRGLWRRVMCTPDALLAQERIDRSLVRALLLGGLIIGVVGFLDLTGSSDSLDLLQPLGGLALTGWSGTMLYRNRPRPMPILVATMVLSLAFLGAALAVDAPLVDFAAPSTITLVVTTGIVAMSTTHHWRLVGAIWLAAVSVSALLIDTGAGAGLALSVSDAIVTGTVATVGMYMVWVSRHVLNTQQQRYSRVANAALLSVSEFNAAEAIATLTRNSVTPENWRERLSDGALRDEFVEGIRVVQANDRALALSRSNNLEETEAFLHRMLRSPFHATMFDRVITTIIDGTPSEYMSDIAEREYFLTKWIRDPTDPTSITALSVEITELKEAEKALEDEIRSKDQFIASVSHELRTPLTAVMGLAEELRSETAPFSDGERKELLDIIAEQTRDISGIVEDLLVAARAELGNIVIAPVSIDLVALVGQSIESVGIAVSLELPASLPVVSDPVRVRQILRNLLTNADRYGGPSIRVTGGIDEDGVFVEFRDDGPPIPTQVQERIFNPYQRGREPRVGTPDSVGLGLTVSRTLAELMEGSLIYQHDGDESIFRLSLPR